MTYRTTRKDLDGAVERLVRNTGLRLQVKEFNGYIHLYNDSDGQAFSNGNTKSELYWQVQLTNKIIEATKGVNK